MIENIPTDERVVIGADFNGHVGEGNTGDEEVMGKFGVKERNLEGQMVVDFAKRMDMAVVNTYFQKREEHRVTYKSGGRSTQVDYILCRRGNLKEISDCKVVVGESGARQHRMVVCRMTLMVCKRKRSKIEIEKKTKWWKLKKQEFCEDFRQKLRQALGGQVVLPDDWETTAEVIRVTGRKVLGVSSGRRKEDKETWWWNEGVQDTLGSNSSSHLRELDLYGNNPGESGVKLLSDLLKDPHCKLQTLLEGSGTVRLQGEEVKKVQEFKYLGSTVQSNGECGKEVKKRVQAGWNGWRKVSGVLCDRKISARIKGKVYKTVVRPAMLYGLETVSLRKRQESELEVAELKMLRFSLRVTREGSGTVRLQGEEVKKVQEFKYLGSTVQSNGECGKEVKKRVQAGWNGWRKVSGDLCDRKISARIKGKVYKTVVRAAMLYGLETVSLRKRQESELEVAELKMLRFSLGVTRLDRIRNEYIRGTAHVGRLGDKVREARLRWFGHVQRRESEYIGRRMLDMELPGRRRRGRPKRREGSGTVRLQGEEVKKVQEFKYLGSTVQSNGECGKEVKKRVQAGWNGWRKVSGVLCDRKISARIKGKVYKTVVRAAMLYGLETVSLRKRQE
ncbi:hypothetical protein PDJAM_G00258220 [Pangasius djambal]|uniref:Uncharacterized protein n=1 Tax=Pangasius djambal TaxID=1691987 RepID=A0ACC5YKH2_9TELE|nr:hypothetical protein [Pangasius djambal]